MKPPRLARLWVRLIAPAELRQSLFDDLDEVSRGARGRYWRETLRCTPSLIRLRIESVRARRRSAATGPATLGIAGDRLRRDARHAWRSLRREPGFALTSILTLALGIGAVTTIFSIVDAQLWKPLPFPNARELVRVYSRVSDGGATALISGAEFLEWRESSDAFAALAADGTVSRQTLQLETAHSVLVSHVTAAYLDVLGRAVVAGRRFVDADAGARAVVLTDRTWRRIFAASPSVVGRQVPLDGQMVTIVGVVQANDSTGTDVNMYLALDERAPAFRDRSQPLFYGAVGRLKPGVDAHGAAAQLSAAAARAAAAAGVDRPRRPIEVEDLSEYYKSANGRPLYFLLGASLVVLLLATTNVAALMLGRAIGRTPEFALRGALGGGRGAMARQLLVEGAIVAIPAGAFGVLIAQWAVRAVATRLPEEVMLRGADIPVDLRVAAVAFAASTITAFVFALTPLAVTRRIDLSAALGAGRRTGQTAAQGRARAILLTAQLALTMVLVSGAAVLLKSFIGLTQVPLGFDPDRLVSLRVLLGGPRYSSETAVRDYMNRLLDAAHATPGVQAAALSSSSPLGSGPLVNFAFDDRPKPATGDEPRAILRAAGPGYFRTLGIRLHRGREFGAADVAGAPRVAIVNEQLARQIAPDGDAIGRTIDLLPGARAAWTRRPGALTIVGVAANIKEVMMNEQPFSGIYVPLAQMTPSTIELAARGAVPAGELRNRLHASAAAIDPAVPVGLVSAFDDRIDSALRPDRFNLQLVSGFALAGVLLAAVGIYGAIAYAVQRRTRELGVRLALGAQPARLMTAAVWQACRVGLAGAVFGLVTILALSRLIGDALYSVPGSHNGLLYRVTTTDPLMLTVAFTGITAVAILAAILPARRIARLDPVRALRSE